jgi:hypothetical protein
MGSVSPAAITGKAASRSIEPGSPAEIAERYRDLQVFKARLAWRTDEMEKQGRSHRAPIWTRLLDGPRH